MCGPSQGETRTDGPHGQTERDLREPRHKAISSNKQPQVDLYRISCEKRGW